MTSSKKETLTRAKKLKRIAELRRLRRLTHVYKGWALMAITHAEQPCLSNSCDELGCMEGKAAMYRLRNCRCSMMKLVDVLKKGSRACKKCKGTVTLLVNHAKTCKVQDCNMFACKVLHEDVLSPQASGPFEYPESEPGGLSKIDGEQHVAKVSSSDGDQESLKRKPQPEPSQDIDDDSQTIQNLIDSISRRVCAIDSLSSSVFHFRSSSEDVNPESNNGGEANARGDPPATQYSRTEASPIHCHHQCSSVLRLRM